MVEIGAIVRIKGPTAKPREAERLMTRTAQDGSAGGSTLLASDVSTAAL